MSEPHEGATRVLAPVVPSEMPSARAVLRVGTAIVALDGTEPAPVILGSGPACTVRLADTSVSRRHCSVELVADGLRVRDLESTNGTFLNGVRIESAYAPHGASLRFGQTEVFVTLVSGQAEALPAVSAFGGLLGRSTELRRLHPLLRRIAAASLPVLIEGETGTGKEIAAEALHSEGPRREGPFVVLDCTTIPAQLAESELFG
ncbi:MAG: FHA domain-containing protein, partial [Proteobacteria bacterium]